MAKMTKAQARKRLGEADRKMQWVSQSATLDRAGWLTHTDQLKLLKMGADLRKMQKKLR